jgi:hypothetical protein
MAKSGKNPKCSFFITKPFKKLNILPIVIFMVHDYSFFGSTADFVIKKEHLGFLPDLADDAYIS